MPTVAESLGVYFLDVGQGDCSFILTGSGEEGVLFDCADSDVAQKFATDKGLRELHAVVVSHLDLDHIRGMHAFLTWWLGKGFSISEVCIDRDRALLTSAGKELLGAVLAWEKAGKLALSRSERGAHPHTVWEHGDARVDIVLPRFGAKLAAELSGGLRANSSSAVLRVVRGLAAILIGGDAPLGSWERLHEHEPDLLVANVFRAPHHGGKIEEGAETWTTETLYERVGAEHVVVSVGTNNAPYGHPRAEHVLAMKPASCRVLCTQLTPRCHPDPLDLRAGFHARCGVTPAYRHLRDKKNEVPCAGSVAARINSAGAVEVDPPRSVHDAFIASLATPLCRPSSIPAPRS